VTTGGGAGAGAAPGGSGGTGVGGTGSGAGGTAGSGGGAGSSGTMEWLPSWATTIQGYESSKSDHVPPIALPNNTIRQFVFPTFTGAQVRLQLSNEKGAEPLQIQKAAIALASGTGTNSMGAIDAASSRPLTFNGMPNVSIPAGQTAWSDGVAFPLAAMKLTAVTLQFGATVPAEFTMHPGSRTTSYFQTGDAVATAGAPSGGTRDRWYFINAIEVMAPADAFALGCLGDSITDGYGIINTFQRWTDALTTRIQADANLRNKVSVLNFGMGANNLTSGGADMDAGKDRFTRDVIARPKVKWVIVLEGVNDINGGVQANTITAAFREIVMEGRAANRKIFGSPITPMGSDNAVRNAVNMSVHTENIFDAVIDFDAAIRDSANQNNIATMYNNDNLHPNAAGYQKMAEAVNLSLLVP
jgi:lysophospholipase L1-like esterase